MKVLSTSGFTTLWQGLGARGNGLTERDSILRRYKESHRKYHDIAHIAQSLSVLEQMMKYVRHPFECRFALVVHDIVYDPTRSDNEEQSVMLATEMLHRAGVESHVCVRVGGYIMATKHVAGDVLDGDTALVVDADLSGLALPWPNYCVYKQGIRKEYEFVPEDDYRAGRILVLNKLLRSDGVYHHPVMRHRYNDFAAANITREIAELESGAPL